MTRPTRSIALQGASNFRDLGGYPGLCGRTVRWRRLFRSDHLARLSAQDQQALAGLGIARAVDLRGEAERNAMTYTLAGVQYHPLTIEPTVVQRIQEVLRSGASLSPQDAAGLMQDTYRGFVHDNAPRFAALLRLLVERDDPLVFHCTAGKDRTGFAAALILLTLGVPREVVMQDYLLTNALYRPPASLASHTPPEVMQVLCGVQEDFLDAALHMVDTQYGGITPYLEDVLGLDAAARSALAQRYLQAE